MLHTLDIKLTDRAAADGGGTTLVVKQDGKEVHNKPYPPGQLQSAKADAMSWVDKATLDDLPGNPPITV